MPLNPNFSTSQTYAEPSEITFTDTSTGSDVTIVSRRISLLTSLGTYLVPDDNTSTQYIDWALANASITVDVLDKTYALFCTVDWLNVSGGVVETKTYLLGFTVYSENFDFTLSQMLSANNPLMNDNKFFSKKSDLRNFIDSGNQSIAYDNIMAAQLCYDEANKMYDGRQYIFNINI